MQGLEMLLGATRDLSSSNVREYVAFGLSAWVSSGCLNREMKLSGNAKQARSPATSRGCRDGEVGLEQADTHCRATTSPKFKGHLVLVLYILAWRVLSALRGSRKCLARFASTRVACQFLDMTRLMAFSHVLCWQECDFSADERG